VFGHVSKMIGFCPMTGCYRAHWLRGV